MRDSDGADSDTETTQTSFRARLSSFAYETPRRKFPILRRTPPPSSTPPQLPRRSSSKKRKRRKCHDSEDQDQDDILPVLTATPSGRRKKRPKRAYAPPEVYDHLHVLQDCLEPYLDVVFCGINPGCTSAEIGHHYAHPTNHFWRTLHESGLTEEQVPPCEDHMLPQSYGYGLTNLVERPSVEQSELSTAEMREGVPLLMNKIAKYRPRIVCFLAKGIWDIFLREAYRLGAPPRPCPSAPKRPKAKPTPPRNQTVASKYFSPPSRTSEPEVPSPSQPQRRRPKIPRLVSFNLLSSPSLLRRHLTGNTPLEVKTTLLFVVPSPSARVVAYQWWDKIKFFVRLREFIQEVKADRADTSSMAVLPLTTNRSIYFLVPQS